MIRFKVVYYDHSRGGTWIAEFTNRAKAEEFAAGKVLYRRPAKVKEVVVSP